MPTFEKTFDDAATDYEQSRPAYVKEIYEDIFRYKAIDSDSYVLEIGLGTGKASQPILETQCHFTGIEPGKQLAAFARKRYQAYANFSLLDQTLQDFTGCDQSFDLIYAATAFHWIPEEYGYNRVYNLLKPGGAFARFAYHAGGDKERKAMMEEIQEIYLKYLHLKEPPKEYGMEDAEKLAETACQYGFVDTACQLYFVKKDFTADEYMALLRTYPDHMKIEEADRKKLFEGIHSVINKHGGIMTVHYTMDLELARKP
ncbi:MAG: class I SAM-dependent methyltransferase [Lachnospiraceae bacterium]|nr:class I SAM-dependent methyltransferase [Lachnospiraceae bacterium]